MALSLYLTLIIIVININLFQSLDVDDKSCANATSVSSLCANIQETPTIDYGPPPPPPGSSGGSLGPRDKGRVEKFQQKCTSFSSEPSGNSKQNKKDRRKRKRCCKKCFKKFKKCSKKATPWGICEQIGNSCIHQCAQDFPLVTEESEKFQKKCKEFGSLPTGNSRNEVKKRKKRSKCCGKCFKKFRKCVRKGIFSWAKPIPTCQKDGEKCIEKCDEKHPVDTALAFPHQCRKFKQCPSGKKNRKMKRMRGKCCRGCKRNYRKCMRSGNGSDHYPYSYSCYMNGVICLSHCDDIFNC